MACSSSCSLEDKLGPLVERLEPPCLQSSRGPSVGRLDDAEPVGQIPLNPRVIRWPTPAPGPGDPSVSRMTKKFSPLVGVLECARSPSLSSSPWPHREPASYRAPPVWACATPPAPMTAVAIKTIQVGRGFINGIRKPVLFRPTWAQSYMGVTAQILTALAAINKSTRRLAPPGRKVLAATGPAYRSRLGFGRVVRKRDE